MHEPTPFPAPSHESPVSPAASRPPAGWYPDPSDPTRWRWFDGVAWTAHVSGPATQRKPRLPRWLSPPVLACGIVVAIGLVVVAVSSPWSVVAGCIPLFIVMPVLSWLDRVEPEPRASRLHALLWGGSVAVVIASIANATVALLFGEIPAMVISAPVVEETAKAMGVVWAVRRLEVDSVSDGIVYAGWVALGFAVVEDITYFAVADVEGALLPTIVLRAFLTPFAHPLFTFWTGLAIGRAVFSGRPVWPAMLWGLALAIVSHAAWNGTLVIGDLTYDVDEDLGTTVLLSGIAVFVLLFVAVTIALVVHRRREQRAFVASVGALVLRYDIGPHEAQLFTGWKPMLQARRRLPRSARPSFDRLHASLARLSMQHQRPNGVDAERERVLVDQLAEALRVYRDH